MPPIDLTVPGFTHDCSECTFLGRVIFKIPWRSEEDSIYDLYTCDKAGWRTFIWRFGDDGPDYESCPQSALPQGPCPPLYEAVRRWRKLQEKNAQVALNGSKGSS